MDYLDISHPEMKDRMMKLLKRSPMTVCICTSARTVALRSLFWGTLFVRSKQTRGDQKFRDYANDKQWKTVLFRVTLVFFCKDTALLNPGKWKWNPSHIKPVFLKIPFLKIIAISQIWWKIWQPDIFRDGQAMDKIKTVMELWSYGFS